MATATYTALTAEQRTFYEMEMLMRAVPSFVHLAAAQTAAASTTEIPENSGATINWRLLGSLPAVTTPLTEGVTPASQDITITSTSATVSSYGAYVIYTRELIKMGIDQLVAELTDVLGEQAGDSLDQLVRDVLVTGTNVIYSGTAGQRNAVSAPLSATEILRAVADLKTRNAMPVADGKYYVIIHPKAEYDLLKDQTFQNLFYYAKERGDNNPLTTGYIGDALGCRFFVSSNVKVWPEAGASSKDVYAALVLGRGAFGVGGLAGYMPAAVKELTVETPNAPNTGAKVRPIRLIQKDFGSAGTSDPLDQRGTLAWYTTFVTKILREPFIVRIEHASTI